MKRTKENWLQTHPFHKTNVSGLQLFDGEDLYYAERKRSMKEIQKKWLDQQMEEAKMKRARSEEEEKLYAHQSFQMNRVRGMLEDELERNKKMMAHSMRDFNKDVEVQKKVERVQERKKRLELEINDLRRQEEIRRIGPYVNPFRKV